MKERVDVIGIGAINFDFVFSSNHSDLNIKDKKIDDGEEIFVRKHVFDDHLLQVEHDAELSQTQIGGSALLAIKTIKSMCSNLRTAYVGVYGDIPECSKKYDFPKNSKDLKSHIDSFIDDTSWMFTQSDNITGCSLIKLYKKQRQFINIYTGANNFLLNKIQEKGKKEFVDFLASAKWVHMTSLKDVYQFKCIADLVNEAKKVNPQLKVSIDPGYDYTKNHWKTLKTILPIVDYVFLSRSEFYNLSLNNGLGKRAKVIALGKELINCNAQPQIIIIKGKNCNILLSLINNTPFIRTYHHKKMAFTRILNDTGAGDAFAGGFIAGMLSPQMLSHQPAPIQLAAIIANERLKSIEWPSNLREVANSFFCKNMKNERLNRRQKFKINLEILKNPTVDFILGIATGLITSAIWTFFTN